MGSGQDTMGSASLGKYQAAVDTALTKMAQHQVMARVWALDYTLWKPASEDITNRLGWLHITEGMLQEIPRLKEWADQARADGYTHAVLLGMGGSSLAPEVFRRTFGVRDGYLDLEVLDSTAPGAVLACAESLDLSRTLFLVSTKSGTTTETLSFFKFFYNRMAEAVGADRAGAHFVAITDPATRLVDLAHLHGFRGVLINDPNIGGRYSALSYFGLLPAALIGTNLQLLLGRAQRARASCGPDVEAHQNPGAWLGTIMGVLAREGRDKLTLVASPSIASFGNWAEQLIAESTGKEQHGIVPIVGEPLAPAESYGQDRLFVSLQVGNESSKDEQLDLLMAAGHPVVRLHLRDRYDLGAQIFLWEMATAVAGYHLGVNPFDQPDVENAKERAREMVAAYYKTGELPRSEPAELSAARLQAFLGQVKPGDYVALQAYVRPTAETEAALQSLRLRLRDHLRAATTWGLGPRFLHSTGQLHKGDAANGVFIQLTADNARDLAIPDAVGSAASSMTFGVLKAAQAQGDQRALMDAGRRVIHFHLGRDVVAGLQQLESWV